ncbi:MAG: hypothetical protein AAB639_03615 [Patescibacteria group bacterium]
MKDKLKKIIPFAIPVAMLALPAVALAQELVPAKLLQTDNIVLVVRSIIRFILLIAFVLAFIMLLIGGIRWITAGGDEKGVAAARNMITAALIGLVIVLIAYALIRLVEIFFNVNIITGTVCIPTVTDPCE